MLPFDPNRQSQEAEESEAEKMVFPRSSGLVGLCIEMITISSKCD